jgi:hypothetical protein
VGGECGARARLVDLVVGCKSTEQFPSLLHSVLNSLPNRAGMVADSIGGAKCQSPRTQVVWKNYTS